MEEEGAKGPGAVMVEWMVVAVKAVATVVERAAVVLVGSLVGMMAEEEMV